MMSLPVWLHFPSEGVYGLRVGVEVWPQGARSQRREYGIPYPVLTSSGWCTEAGGMPPTLKDSC